MKNSTTSNRVFTDHLIKTEHYCGGITYSFCCGKSKICDTRTYFTQQSLVRMANCSGTYLYVVCSKCGRKKEIAGDPHSKEPMAHFIERNDIVISDIHFEPTYCCAIL